MSDTTAASATVEWRLFADLAATAGTHSVMVTLPDRDGDPTLGDALAALVDEEPALAGDATDGEGAPAERLTVLRNGQRVEDASSAVADGDELALMPPVAGG